MIEDLSYFIFNDSLSFSNLTENSVNRFDDPSSSSIFSSGSIPFDVPSSHPYPVQLNIVLAVVGTLISLLTISGNVLVLLSFFVDRQIRHPTNYFIFSLAVSDFLIGFISMPFLTLAIYKNKWVLGSFLCDIWLSLDYTVCLASIYTVLLITVDRFCSVKLPTKYRNWRTERRIIILVLLTWIIPAVIFFASTMGYPLYSKKPNLSKVDLQCDVQWNKNPYFNLGLTIAYFWITLLVMFTLYFFIYQVASALEKRSQATAKKVSNLIGVSSSAMTNLVINMSKTSQMVDVKCQSSSKKVDATNRSSSNETSGEQTPERGATPSTNLQNFISLTKSTIESKKENEEDRSLLSHGINSKNSILNPNKKTNSRTGNHNKARKALRTITVIMGAFVLCWTPWHIHTIIQTFCQTCRNSLIFNTYLFHACYYLCYLNSPINPFCYALANRQFKKTYTRLLRCDFRKL